MYRSKSSKYSFQLKKVRKNSSQNNLWCKYSHSVDIFIHFIVIIFSFFALRNIFFLLSFTLYFFSVNSRDSKRDVNGFRSSYSAHTYFFSSLFRFINVRPFSILNKNTICAYIFLKIYKKVRTQRMSNWKKWKRRQKNLRRITFSSFLMIYCQLFIFMSDFCFSLSHKVVAVNFKSILFALRLVWVLRIFFVCLFYIIYLIYFILNEIFVLR